MRFTGRDGVFAVCALFVGAALFIWSGRLVPLIELTDLHFSYPGQNPVLKGASLSLQAGDRLTISGHNGAGKSTLLRMVVGLLKPERGTIKAFGTVCRSEPDFRPVRQKAGFVFQDPDDQLFCPTVAEDIAFGPLNLGKSRMRRLKSWRPSCETWTLFR
jgi:cobalt/nickel transport system ATP-binding protein